ncbi:MAG: hypothetical protein P8011_09975 [Acidihalobacter sp.]|jgi:ABC-type uncharacterized transport system involved in gliding motility auxiliary subunit
MASPEITEFNETNNQIVVTPQSPLVINETQIEFDDVVIEGGVISAVVDTKVTFKKLTKSS